MLQKVQELFDPISGNWDEQLVREIFWPVDAERILQIPLSSHGQSDFISWHLDVSLFVLHTMSHGNLSTEQGHR